MAPRSATATPAKPKPATPKDVRQATHDMSPEFLRCHAFGHPWDPHTVADLGRSYEVTLRCARCKSEAKQIINKRGILETARKYDYAEGYLFKGLGRVQGNARGAVRIEAIVRSLEDRRGKLKAV